jgi:hypothetical protein
MSDRPHAAFLIPHPYVDSLACFRELIRAVAADGWHVDLFTTPSSAHPPPFFEAGDVRVHALDRSKLGTVRLIAALAAHRPRYRWLFAVPQWALHYAAAAAAVGRIPLACVSDEMSADAEATTPAQRLWRDRECRAHRRCAFTIALSEARGEFVRRENRLGPAHQIYVVPNAAPGPAVRLPSRYYQDTLAIPADRFVVLHAGSWWWRDRFAAIEDIAKRWHDDAVLVFQGRMRDDSIVDPGDSHIRFSTAMLPSTLLDYATSSAHAGLALYDPATANHREVGTASGKIALYMKNALPVITTDQPSLRWIEREGCGVCISDLSQIGDAIRRIRADYAGYVQRVTRAYGEHFDFSRALAPVLERMRAGIDRAAVA